MATQGNQNLIIVDEQPSVTKLWNGRTRIEFFCDHSSKNTGWHEGNITNILPAFGIALGDKFGVGEWSSDAGYADNILVSAELEFVPSASTHYVKLAYETITASFVQEKDDDTDYELNGLKRVSRSLIAVSGTAYTGVIGTTTLGSDGTTLYLATFQIDDTDAYSRVEEVWIEAGKVSESEANPEDGIKSVTEKWWKVIGTTAGPIKSRSTENFQGFQIYTTTSVTGPNGEDLSAGDTQVADFQTLVPWTRPGVIGINQFDVGDTGDATGISIYQTPPVQMKLRAHVEIFYSQDAAISDADFDTITGGTGVEFWNPDEWAKLVGGMVPEYESSNIEDIDRTYRGFRVITASDAAYSSSRTTSGVVNHGEVLLAWQNGRFFGKFTSFDAVLPNGTTVAEGAVSGGPVRPEGKIWVVDVQNPKAFTDMDGNDYYKKTYVWSYIPDFDLGEDIWDDA
jgi:hypothetical protein